jgi:hypothetical protein
MTTPLSIRFSPSLLARLRQRASPMTGADEASARAEAAWRVQQQLIA